VGINLSHIGLQYHLINIVHDYTLPLFLALKSYQHVFIGFVLAREFINPVAGIHKNSFQ
jgi:hypothetical protein